MSIFPKKINDLTDSPIKDRFNKKDFVPETNLAVAMGRVSVKKNKDKGNSDIIQLEEIENYVKKKKLKLVREPWDVAETAAVHAKRKNFHELIEFVEDSQETQAPVKHVIFAYTSRGSRNKKSKRVIEELIDMGVSVHFIQDNLVLTSEADMSSLLTWEVKSIKDQEDVVKLKQITWDGTVKRLELGLFPGKAPFGYRNRREKKLGGVSIFVFEKREAEFMKKYFEMFATGLYTQAELYRNLKKSFSDIEVPHETRINAHIRNPFYYGDFIFSKQLWHGNPELHPSLISREMWDKVQDILKERESPRKDNLIHSYVQLMACGGFLLDEQGNETDKPCGGSITAETVIKPLLNGSKNEHVYYRCGSRMSKKCSQRNRNYLKIKNRRTISYTESEIEKLFLKVTHDLTFSPEKVEWMRETLINHHQQMDATENQRLMGAHARYQQLFQFRKHVYEDRLNGLKTPTEWKSIDDDFKTEQEHLKGEIDSVTNGAEDRINQGITLIELLEHTGNIWEKASNSKKVKILKALVSNLTLRDGSIGIVYRKPFDLLAESGGKEKWLGC